LINNAIPGDKVITVKHRGRSNYRKMGQRDIAYRYGW